MLAPATGLPGELALTFMASALFDLPESEWDGINLVL